MGRYIPDSMVYLYNNTLFDVQCCKPQLFIAHKVSLFMYVVLGSCFITEFIASISETTKPTIVRNKPGYKSQLFPH